MPPVTRKTRGKSRSSDTRELLRNDREPSLVGVARLIDGLAKILPKIKTPTQLGGFVAVVGALLATTQVQPANVKGTLAIGGIGVFLVVFAQFFASLDKIPRDMRAMTLLAMSALLVVLVLGGIALAARLVISAVTDESALSAPTAMPVHRWSKTATWGRTSSEIADVAKGIDFPSDDAKTAVSVTSSVGTSADPATTEVQVTQAQSTGVQQLAKGTSAEDPLGVTMRSVNKDNFDSQIPPETARVLKRQALGNRTKGRQLTWTADQSGSP